MSVVGYDLGAETCVISVAHRRVINVMQNQTGKRKTPSIVAFQGKVRRFADDALAEYMGNWKNSVRCIKRLIGRSFDDPELKEEQAFLPHKMVKMPNGLIGMQLRYNDEEQVFSAEQIMGALFQELKTIAELGLEGLKVADCVIGVPVWWDDRQRIAIMDAAKIAGLNPLRLMNETAAIALSFGMSRPLPEKDAIKIMFIDFGHSSTSASIATFVQGKLTILGTASDRNLGARNFDRVLVNHFAHYVKTKYKLDVLSDPKATMKLFKECERIKVMLSANSKVVFNVEYIMNDTDVSGTIERQEFEDMCGPLLQQFVAVADRLLQQTKTTKEELASVEIVGGGSRIPMIQRVFKDYFGREMSKTCDADESVTKGCALQCAMLSPNFVVKNMEVHDSHQHGVEIAWGPMNDHNQVDGSALLFAENNVIPSIKMVSFKDRESFHLTARYAKPQLMGAGVDPIIARWNVSGSLPADAPPGEKGKVKVKVKLDANGLLSVTSAQLLYEVPLTADELKDVPMTDAKPAGDKKEEKSAAAPAASPMDEDEPADKKDASDKPVKMDTDAASDKPKTKSMRVNMTVTQVYGHGMAKKDLDAAFEREAAMHSQDHLVAETDARRNELESYILEMRGALENSLAEYSTPAERASFVQSLDEMESWLYGDGSEAQKSDYVARLTTLKTKHGDAIKHRKLEHESRGHAVSTLRNTMTKYAALATSTEEKYAHIAQADKDKILNECVSLEQWLGQTLAKQEAAPLHQNPILTTAELQHRREQLESLAYPIMSKPKPAPAPQPKPEEKKAAADPAAAAPTNDVPMTDANAPPAAKMDTDAGSPPPAGADAGKNMDLD